MHWSSYFHSFDVGFVGTDVLNAWRGGWENWAGTSVGGGAI